MTQYGGITTTSGDARRAHLALVQGGAQDARASVQDATHAAGVDAVRRTERPAAGARTGYASAAGSEAPRSRHEQSIRAVAQQYHTFDEALVHMVRASGVSSENAEHVAAAIQQHPALRSQAERAFQRARLSLA